MRFSLPGRRLQLALRFCAYGLAFLSGLLAHAAVDPSRLTDAHSAAEALNTLEYIKAELPAGDGIAGFNDLYTVTTSNIVKAIKDGRFEDGAAIDHFTAEFANFYLSALRHFLEGSSGTPLAWQTVFSRGARADQYRTVQFAFTGMAAHIGRDLPILLKSLYQDRASYPAFDSSEYRDYLMVNQILGETFDQVENHLFGDIRPLACEVLLQGAAEVGAVPSIKALRYKAWFDGKALWKLGGHRLLSWEYTTGLDAGVAASNRAVFVLKHK